MGRANICGTCGLNGVIQSGPKATPGTNNVPGKCHWCAVSLCSVCRGVGIHCLYCNGTGRLGVNQMTEVTQ